MARLHTRVASAAADVGMGNPFESRRDDLGARRDDLPRGAGLDTAVREAERIRNARGWHASHASRGPREEAVNADTNVVARARGPLRRWLSGRALLLVQLRAVDPMGRIVTSRIVPVAVSGATWRSLLIREDWSLQDLARALAVHLDSFIAAQAQAFANDDSSRVVHREFWTTACARAVAIADGVTPEPTELFQPGLFDRRADRVRTLRTDEQRALADLLMRRVARLEAELDTPSALPARLLLMLP